MTNQPSQRAMKAAQILCDELQRISDSGKLVTHKLVPHVDLVAQGIDAEFPAYLEIREALEQMHALFDYEQNDLPEVKAEKDAVIAKAEAALAKARKD